jgi:hypothetical protein
MKSFMTLALDLEERKGVKESCCVARETRGLYYKTFYGRIDVYS